MSDADRIQYVWPDGLVTDKDERPAARASVILGRITVCQCCMLCHANGECCGEHEGPEPLGLVSEGQSVTMGLSADEHRERCTPKDREVGACECDQLGFSWERCDSCGTGLGGDRYALTLWQD